MMIFSEYSQSYIDICIYIYLYGYCDVGNIMAYCDMVSILMFIFLLLMLFLRYFEDIACYSHVRHGS